LRTTKILSTLVENKPGTLFKVVHLIRLMRINIEGLALGVTNRGDTCRMIFTVDGDDATLEHIAKQLRKVIDVLEANTYSPEEVTSRELALVKIQASDRSRSVMSKFHGHKVIDSSGREIIVQVVASPAEIDDFVQRLGSDVLDIARTGVTALPREKT
jgi:acetolactate synthase-1/3 small subunit